jgi:hypothetical protein
LINVLRTERELSLVMKVDPNEHDLLVIFLVSVIVILLASEVGRWLGRGARGCRSTW